MIVDPGTRAFVFSMSARVSAATCGVNLSMKPSSCACAFILALGRVEVRHFRLQLEQEVGVEVIIFRPGEVTAGKPADGVEVIPQGEHLHMHDVALMPVQAPGTAIALGRSIVGKATSCMSFRYSSCLAAGI